MCVIIVKKEGLRVPRQILRNSAILNPHGLGVLWMKTGEVVRTESLDHTLIKLLSETEEPFIAHFRYATRGKVSRDNTHPFRIKGTDEWLFQNGTVAEMGDECRTDTEEMAEVLSNTERWGWLGILESTDCRWVTFNDKDFQYQIYNKRMWSRLDGVWYSKPNVLHTIPVAVYGTLKRGFGNYERLLSEPEQASFVGSGHTTSRYPLEVRGIPYLYEMAGKGHHVKVDIFMVDNKTLRKLDVLEGHPSWYKRKMVWISTGSGKRKCWVYFMQGEPESNEFYAEYGRHNREDIHTILRKR
jgi:gamma-glutamylcyclotransferase (GGCT)/AIG2-like uncharacterized protein YtfP